MKTTTMRKSEMSGWQLASRAAFVDQIVAAGWDPGGWEILFASDANVSPEAQAEYLNAPFDMRLSYFVADQYLFFEAVAKVGELAFALRLYPAGDAVDVVAKIVKAQETLSEANFSILVEDLKPLCRMIVFDKGNGELVEIS
jgi:hypothetical protein